MGLFKKSCYTNSSSDALQPNPAVFTIKKQLKLNKYWIAIVYYPNCTNYEGNKIVVLSVDPSGLKTLDPHFTEGGPIVARFPPTKQGEKHAISFCINAV